LGGVKVDDTPDIAVAAGELRIALGKRRFVYDRLGLRPAKTWSDATGDVP
jgi:hypothetical protein